MRIINNDKQFSISIIACIMYEDLFFWTNCRDDAQVYGYYKQSVMNNMYQPVYFPDLKFLLTFLDSSL